MKTLLIFMLGIGFAAAKGNKLDGANFGYPKDISDKCADAIFEALSADIDAKNYMDGQNYSQDLDWDEKGKSLAINIQFDDDVRDGYLTGEVEIETTADSCSVKDVSVSIGD